MTLVSFYYYLMLFSFLFFTPLKTQKNENILSSKKSDSFIVYLSKEGLLNEQQYKAITCFTDDCILRRIETKVDDLTELNDSCCDVTHDIESIVEVNSSLLEVISSLSSCETAIDQNFVDSGGVISSSGSYCLVEDVSFSLGTNTLTITADNVVLNLNNHTISGGGTNGIALTATSNVTIYNGTLDGMPTGIDATSTTNNLLLKNLVILSTVDGIDLITCANVTIQDCTLSGMATGIDATTSSSNIVIEDTNIYGATSAGINLDTCTGVRCANLSINDTTGNGIDLTDTSLSTFENILIAGDGAASTNGILITRGINCDFENIEVKNCINDGFQITVDGANQENRDITFTQCSANNNTDAGFTIRIDLAGINLTTNSISNVIYKECTSLNNSGSGFTVDITGLALASATVNDISYINCISQSNTGSGFELISSPATPADSITRITYDSSITKNNGSAGFSVDHINVLVKDCIISQNTINGIEFNSNSLNCTCLSNQLTLNTGVGILVSGTNILIDGNTVLTSSSHGIEFDSSATSCTCLSNELISNTGNGILADTSNILIKGNSVLSSGGDGIQLTAASTGCATGFQNQLLFNTGFGLNNGAAVNVNKVYGNFASLNGSGNYTGAFDLSPVGANNGRGTYANVQE